MRALDNAIPGKVMAVQVHGAAAMIAAQRLGFDKAWRQADAAQGAYNDTGGIAFDMLSCRMGKAAGTDQVHGH